jgi:lysophospholipase L1-like esterase
MPRTLRNAIGNWSLTPPWALIVISFALAFQIWSITAADPDFFLPNPAPWFAAHLLLLFVITGLVRSSYARSMLRVFLGVLPIGALLVAEVWTRMGDEGSFERIQRVDDPILRYHYRPGADGINELGLADKDHAVAKRPGVFRVVLLGDSVPNDRGIPQAERFPARLEARLNENASGGIRYEVINVSCSGYNTEQEVRLLERVGLLYQPDFVLLAYVLNDPFMQDGSRKRVGSSFFAFRLLPLWNDKRYGSQCRFFAGLHTPYAFSHVVDRSLERLEVVARTNHFGVAIATLPLVAPFEDPECGALYDRVGAAAKSHGFDFVRLVDGFVGQDYRDYQKPWDRLDATHPNARGHEQVATLLARDLRPLLTLREAK